jgi:hypothetical protein
MFYQLMLPQTRPIVEGNITGMYWENTKSSKGYTSRDYYIILNDNAIYKIWGKKLYEQLKPKRHYRLTLVGSKVYLFTEIEDE